MKQLKLLQLQLALFFEDIEMRPDRFVSEISDNIFDQMPIILPVPQDAPAEIPVVMLNSSDGKYSCNIARSRIDFVLNNMNSNNDILDDLIGFINSIRSYVAIIFGKKRIIRFGLIGQYFIESNNAVNTIETKYLKNTIGNLEELNIRYNKRFNSESMMFNDVVEIGKGSITNENITKDGVVIQRDINNVPENKSIEIEEMFMAIKSKLNDFDAKGIMEIV